MKILRITTHWTTEEADCIYQLLGQLQSAIWQSYGDDIEKMHQMIWEAQQERADAFTDEIPF